MQIISILDHQTVDNIIYLPVIGCCAFLIEGWDGGGNAK